MFFLSIQTHQALDLQSLSLEIPEKKTELVSLHGKSVYVRGFWYPLSDQSGILSHQPNIKSCCIGTSHTIQQQLVVKGQVENLSTQKAITLEGIFTINPQYDSTGQPIQMYVLESARELNQMEHSPVWIVLLVCSLLVLCAFWVCSKLRFCTTGAA